MNWIPLRIAPLLWLALTLLNTQPCWADRNDDLAVIFQRNHPVLQTPVPYPEAVLSKKDGSPGPTDVMNRCLLLGNGNIEASVSAKNGEAAKLWFAVNKNDFWRSRLTTGEERAKAFGHYVPTRTVNLNPGYLSLDFPDLEGGEFRQELNLQKAEIVTHLQKGHSQVQIRSLIPKPSGGFLLNEITNLGTEPIQVDSGLWVAQVPMTNSFMYDLETGKLPNDPGIGWASRLTPLGKTQPDLAGVVSQFRMWAALAGRVISDDPSVQAELQVATLNNLKGVRYSVRLPAGKSCWFVVNVSSTGIPLTPDPKNPVPEAVASLEKITTKDLGKIAEDHQKWWDEYWQHSYVRLDEEPKIENFYYGSQYIYGCVNQPGQYTSGCNSYGVNDAPMWTGDYHWNYNIESPYYQAWSSDRVDLSEPYDRAVLEHDKLGRTMAQVNHSPGTFFCIGTAPGGQINENTSGYAHRSNAVEAADNLVDHYFYTYDTEWLKKMYPFLKAVAEYWDHSLQTDREVLPNGKYRYNITQSAPLEGVGGSLNATPTLGFVKRFFQGMLVMTEDLNKAGYPTGYSEADLTRWRDYLDHLADYPVGEAFGRPYFRWAEDDKDCIAVGGWHWNMLHIYPCKQIGLSSPPEMLKLAENSIQVLGKRAVVTEYYSILALIGHDSAETLGALNADLEKMGPNYFINDGCNVECVAGVDAIHNFLIQSQEGFLRFFPSWYRDNARFGGVRTEGAFLVDAELKDRVCQNIHIKSEKGRLCRFMNPWTGKTPEVLDENGKSVPLSASTPSGVFEFSTQPGASYTIQPIGGFPEAQPYANVALHCPVTTTSVVDPASAPPDKLVDAKAWIAKHPTEGIASASKMLNAQTWAPSHLTDGNKNFCSVIQSNMGWASICHPTENAQESVTIDLGKEQTIQQVNLWPITRGDTKYGRYDKELLPTDHSYDGFPMDFTIQVSTDNIHWKTVATETNYLSADQTGKFIKWAQGPETFHFEPQVARYVRLDCSRLRFSRFFGAYGVQLSEIEVLR